MENLLIIGSGGLGRMLLEIAKERFNCFFVDDAFSVGELICQTKIVGHTDELGKLARKYRYAIVGIGNNDVRKRLTKRLLDLHYLIPTIISSKAYISPYSQIGFGTIVLPLSSIQNGAKVGNGCVIASQVELHHDCFVGDFVTIYPNTTIRTCARIENNVKIGSNVSIGNNACISENEEISNGEIR